MTKFYSVNVTGVGSTQTVSNRSAPLALPVPSNVTQSTIISNTPSASPVSSYPHKGDSNNYNDNNRQISNSKDSRNHDENGDGSSQSTISVISIG
jgi:hypothetical protein